MTKLYETTPAQVQMTIWQIALTPKTRTRAATSGGPRSQAAHLAYQRAYEAQRRTYGVRLGLGGTAYYVDRAKANRVRGIMRGLRLLGCLPSLAAADMAASGLSAVEILSRCTTCCDQIAVAS